MPFRTPFDFSTRVLYDIVYVTGTEDEALLPLGVKAHTPSRPSPSDLSTFKPALIDPK